MPSNFFEVVQYGEGKHAFPSEGELDYQKFPVAGFHELRKAKDFARKIFPAAAKKAAKMGVKNFSIAVVNEFYGNVLLRLGGSTPKLKLYSTQKELTMAKAKAKRIGFTACINVGFSAADEVEAKQRAALIAKLVSETYPDFVEYAEEDEVEEM
jgi:hypothetical protein